MIKLCLTRQSKSHKALRKCYGNYIIITEVLNYLKINGPVTSMNLIHIFNLITTLQLLVC